ncbi:uncharacterized protein LOC122900658 isoform X4 [Neovison vison]|uniref:uncharacterized protein LOC122900658 isoform X4 n=1 Tax=Neovison vison TaxID=452646 RepID=UPI001CF014F5|nr:uncharacterized protein LOC122900658 isoform X4 [Neogale vison]
MHNTSQVLPNVPAFCGRRSGTSRLLAVCMPFSELVRPEREGVRGEKDGEIRGGLCVAPRICCGRRCPAVGKRPADPGGSLGCSSGELGTRRPRSDGGITRRKTLYYGKALPSEISAFFQGKPAKYEEVLCCDLNSSSVGNEPHEPLGVCLISTKKKIESTWLEALRVPCLLL